MKKSYIKLLATLLVVTFAFANCQKVEEMTSKSAITKAKDIRHFKDFDELYSEIEKTLSFSLEELYAYEKEIGFNSFGKLANKEMEPILKDVEDKNTKSPRLTKEYIQNSKFIHLVTEDGEDFCRPKYHRSIFTYIMNENGMFQVDTLSYKVFEDGHVYCSSAYYDKLCDITEKDFAALKSNEIFTVFKHSKEGKGNYGTYVANSATIGTEKVTVEVWWSPIKYTYGLPGAVLVEGAMMVKTHGNHLFSGIWWTSHRTHQQSMRGQLFVPNYIKTATAGGIDIGYNVTNIITRVYELVPSANGKDPDIYIYSAVGWGSVPAVTCYMNYQ